MKKIVIGNWKMNPLSLKEARVIFNDTVKTVKQFKNIDIVICPPFPFLSIGDKLNNQNIHLGSQNVFTEKAGSYTGEVSSNMLSSIGVEYVIVGHSERRILGDTDKIINKKVLTALKSKLTPIVCVGENTRDRNGFYLAFIKHQIIECLSLVPKNQVKNIIFAYEPVWAIGENATHEATVDEFIEIQIFIKKIIADLYDMKTATSIRIIYGGSVHSSNAKGFVDAGAGGLLVGRDSLSPKKFGDIVKIIQ